MMSYLIWTILSSEFSRKVAVSSRNDEVGEVAETDPIILSPGLEYYKKRYYKEKGAKICTKIPYYFRNLAKITIETERFAECRSEPTEKKDIISETNLGYVANAVNNLVKENGDIHH
jgi:hypothetical protein